MTKQKWKSYLDGPKSANIKTLLFDLSVQTDLELVVLDVDKRWFTETVWYEIIGEPENINTFRRALERLVKKLNGE